MNMRKRMKLETKYANNLKVYLSKSLINISNSVKKY